MEVNVGVPLDNSRSRPFYSLEQHENDRSMDY